VTIGRSPQIHFLATCKAIWENQREWLTLATNNTLSSIHSMEAKEVYLISIWELIIGSVWKRWLVLEQTTLELEWSDCMGEQFRALRTHDFRHAGFMRCNLASVNKNATQIKECPALSRQHCNLHELTYTAPESLVTCKLAYLLCLDFPRQADSKWDSHLFLLTRLFFQLGWVD